MHVNNYFYSSKKEKITFIMSMYLIIKYTYLLVCLTNSRISARGNSKEKYVIWRGISRRTVIQGGIFSKNCLLYGLRREDPYPWSRHCLSPLARRHNTRWRHNRRWRNLWRKNDVTLEGVSKCEPVSASASCNCYNWTVTSLPRRVRSIL